MKAASFRIQEKKETLTALEQLVRSEGWGIVSKYVSEEIERQIAIADDVTRPHPERDAATGAKKVLQAVLEYPTTRSASTITTLAQAPKRKRRP